MANLTHHVPVEVRTADDDDGPRLYATLIQEGRAAQHRRHAEVFAPGSIDWPSTGVGVVTEHYGRPEVRALPVRQSNGEIQIAVRATPAIVSAVESGKTGMSVEFRAVADERLPNGVREITRAMVDVVALAKPHEAVYGQGRAEVRTARRKRAAWR